MLEYKINQKLKRLFKCIKQNQYNSNGDIIPTGITIKENVLELQESGTGTPRVSARNYIYGIVARVEDTYVVMKATNPCDKLIYYTILYSNILYIGSDVIAKIDIEECLDSSYDNMDKFCQGETFNIGNLITEAIDKNYNSNKSFEFIFDGIISNPHPIQSVKVFETMIIVEDYFVTPINVIKGFALVPNCE